MKVRALASVFLSRQAVGSSSTRRKPRKGLSKGLSSVLSMALPFLAHGSRFRRGVVTLGHPRRTASFQRLLTPVLPTSHEVRSAQEQPHSGEEALYRR